jgi:hemerythrin-like domain-containing protein
MTTPLDAVTAIHNAFRGDIAAIDKAALAFARGDPAAVATIERFRFFNEVLVWHADGEELAVFPVLESVAPSVAEAYLKDHRGLDTAFRALDGAYSARDPLETARATAAFKFHLDIHLAKEDTHLYRLFRERVSVPEQGKAVGIMAHGVPPDRFPEMIGWMFPLLGDDDRENMTRILKQVNPPEAFAGAAQLIRKAVGADWGELERRIPELAGLL